MGCTAVLRFTLSCSPVLLCHSSSVLLLLFLLSPLLPSHRQQTLHKHFTFLSPCVCFFSLFVTVPSLLAPLFLRCLIRPRASVPLRGRRRGNQARFNHVMTNFCQLGECQAKILAGYKLSSFLFCPLCSFTPSPALWIPRDGNIWPCV